MKAIGLVAGVTLLATALVLAASGRQTTADPAAAALPRFDRGVLLETTSETSANVSFGDLNGDGNLDVVLAKGRHWPLVDRVLLGDGRGGFPTAYDLGTASNRSYSGRLVDLDGDGDLDVVISNDAPDPKVVYLNDGTGHFRLGSAYGRPDWPTRNAGVADLNGDKLPDIVVANRFGDQPGANYVCLNRGKGQFDSDCIAFSHESATTITPGDFNHDGKAGFAKRIPFSPADATIRMAEAADFDADGSADLVAIDEKRGVFLFFGRKDGTFSAGVSVGDPKVTPYALLAGDLNHDGRIDFVVGNVEAPSAAYFNDGTGRHFTAVSFGDNKGAVYGFAIGDLNKDGVIDIGAARSDAPNVVYFGSCATPCKSR